MKTKIDWDNAPMDATHYASIDDWKYFISSYGYYVLGSAEFHPYGLEHDTGECYSKEEFTIIEPRPVTSEINPITEDKVSCYVCHVGAFPIQQYCGSCGHELLSESIPKTEVKPIYTQAMADNNILPMIGMDYLDEDGQVCVAIGHYSSFVAGVQAEHLIQQYPAVSVSRNNECKPITPPIELINGEAYQFMNRTGEILNGIYNKERDILTVEQGRYFDLISVTHIKPLTV